MIEGNLKRFEIAPRVEIALMNRSVSVARWTVDGLPEGVRMAPMGGELVPAQTKLVAVMLAEGTDNCMVAVLVEKGSRLVLELRLDLDEGGQ